MTGGFRPQREMAAWAVKWRHAVGRLGFDADAPPEDVSDFVLALDQVFGELEKAGEKSHRIAGMQNNYEKYTQRVNDLLDEIAPDLKSIEATRGLSNSMIG